MRTRAFLAGFLVAFVFSAVTACVGEEVAPIPSPEPDSTASRQPSDPDAERAANEDRSDPPEASPPVPLEGDDAGDGGDGGCDGAPPSRLAQPCGAGGAACEEIFESCCKGKTGISCVALDSTCTNNGGAVLSCTKTADCTVPGKTKCCAALVVPAGVCAEPVLKAGSTCRSSCPTTETELCTGSVFECPSAKPTCLGATARVGKDSVRIGRCVAKTP